jgi:uncharacterized membrane protein YkgB
VVLAVLLLQLLGTFGVLFLLPDVAFQDGNPLKLTVEGEFVVKNVVLLAAAMVVGSRLKIGSGREGSDSHGPSDPV